ncbi:MULTISPECIES: hypothetical protein [unclassified Variovorax]|uniref:hypothetical protein n=1 Tax=unclassified Variovorax TaxID=663243 RepID=UPI001BD43CCF|nr:MULTISPECIES: hypothetical protein [unclassified Variovorax]
MTDRFRRSASLADARLVACNSQVASACRASAGCMPWPRESVIAELVPALSETAQALRPPL